ncbi:hypothetical protein HU200_016317 [Digitaria exilis]|uniref:DUF4220 domain-containing protein n=1 Tax=Digitaria exilis TaxID=1010633 RepID=A0A835F9S4_9POAL|nr:hypothetical protein HU200_016317 [Digitaria exilis]
MKKWVLSLCLKCRLKIMKHWEETIGQCSILVLPPRPIMFDLIRRTLRLPDHEKKVKCPELLPDEEEWKKSLYNSVKEDVRRVLSVWARTGPLTPEVEYLELVQLLSEYSENEVLKNGVRLGKQLVELVEGEETSWEMLSGFWAEMILYIAPSKNLIGHSNAIARGGELITLLWALLFHVGIASRPDYTNVTATTANIV